jgi:hypothetical protein
MLRAKPSPGLILTVVSLVSATSAAFIGDILIRDNDGGGTSSDVAHGVRLANPDRLWPGGVVYYK